MFGLLLLGLLSVGATAFVIDDLMEEDETSKLPEGDPEDAAPPEPEAEDGPPDIGASFEATGNLISIDVGEDESGSLVAITWTSELADETDAYTYERQVQFYLVPEGMAFPPSVEDVAAANPDLEQPEGMDGALYTNDYLSNLGATPLGTYDLGSYSETQAPPSGATVIDNQLIQDLAVETSQPITYFNLGTETTDEGAVTGDPIEDAEGGPFATLIAGEDADVTVLVEDGQRTFNITPQLANAGDYNPTATSIPGVNLTHVSDDDVVQIDVSDVPPGNFHMVENYFEINGGFDGYTGSESAWYTLVWTPPEITDLNEGNNIGEAKTLALIHRGSYNFWLDYVTYELVETGSLSNPTLEISAPISSVYVEEFLQA